MTKQKLFLKNEWFGTQLDGKNVLGRVVLLGVRCKHALNQARVLGRFLGPKIPAQARVELSCDEGHTKYCRTSTEAHAIAHEIDAICRRAQFHPRNTS